jgi:hypothetical protein
MDGETMMEEMETTATRVAASAMGVLVLTSLHHAYGAWIYDTPWRYHAVAVSGVAAVAIVGSLILLRRVRAGLPRALALGAFVLATLPVPILLFGAFEGLYNHVIKNILYFGGGSPALLARLFPPPQYEMPNDLIFEVSGIVQVVPALLGGWFMYRLLRPTALRASAGRTPSAAAALHAERPGASPQRLPPAAPGRSQRTCAW